MIGIPGRQAEPGIVELLQGIFRLMETQQRQIEELQGQPQAAELCVMSARKYAETRNLGIETVLGYCHAPDNGFPAAKLGDRTWKIDAHEADLWIRKRLFENMANTDVSKTKRRRKT